MLLKFYQQLKIHMILDSEKHKKIWKNIFTKYLKSYYDIYYHPEYVIMNCLKKKSKGCMFVYREKNLIWVHVFIKILLPNLTNKHKYYDLETPYGYGGPLSNSSNKDFLLRANMSFLTWAKKNSIVAEFLRFHPLYENQNKILNTTMIENRFTCGISIDHTTKNYLFFKSKQRNLIKSANRNLVVRFSRNYKYFLKFKKTYLNLMIEKKANKELFFSNTYFSNLYKFIKKNGFIARVVSKKNNDDVAYGIFLFSDKYAHYHLSAPCLKNYTPGSINLMIYKSLMFSKKLNKFFLHLGGGNSSSADDTLFKFKQSMSNQLCSYKIGKRIFNKEFYDLNKKNWQKKYPMLSKTFSKYLLCYHLDDNILQK